MQDDRELSISCPFHLSGDEEEPVRVVTDGNHEIVSGLLLDLFIQKAYVLLESQSERVMEYYDTKEHVDNTIKDITNFRKCLEVLGKQVQEIQAKFGRGDQSFDSFILEFHNKNVIYAKKGPLVWYFQVFNAVYDALADLRSSLRDLYSVIALFTLNDDTMSEELVNTLRDLTYRENELDDVIGSTSYLIHYLNVNRN